MNILRMDHPTAKKLAALRSEIDGTRKAIAATEKMPFSLAETEARIRAGLRWYLDSNRGSWLAPTYRSRIIEKLDGLPLFPKLSWARFIAHTGGEEAFIKREMAHAAELDATDAGITDGDRKKKLDGLKAALRGLEEKEERECLRLEESERWIVLRRGDADPRLALEIWCEYRPEAAPSAPAKPLVIAKPRHLNDGAASSGPPVNLR